MLDGAPIVEGSQISSAEKVYSRHLLDQTREIRVGSSIGNKVCRKQSIVHAIKKAIDVVEGERCDIVDFLNQVESRLQAVQEQNGVGVSPKRRPHHDILTK